MELPRTIFFAASLLVALAAVLLARRHRYHLPFAVCATWFALADWLRVPLAATRANAARPYTDWARAAFHLDQVIILSFSFGFVAVGLHYFTRIKPAWVLVPYAVVLLLCLDYPAMRGESLEMLYRGVSLAECLVVWSAIIWAMVARDDLTPSVSHLVVMLWAASEVIVAAVPFATDFFGDWEMVRMANLVTALACVVAQTWQLVQKQAPARGGG